MHRLSNIFRRDDSPPPSAQYRPVERQEIHAALQLILGARGRPADHAVVLDFLRQAVRRDLPLMDTWVAQGEQRMLWAALPIVSPGRTMLLLTPGQVQRSTAPAAGQLIQRVCAVHAARGVHLAQVLLDPGSNELEAMYQRCGFERLAELIYLRASTQRAPASSPPPPEGWSWLTYEPARHELFRKAILDSYVQSRDCPRLSGTRDIEDVIAGHRASGIHDPTLWFVLMRGEQPMGVMLLSVTVPGEAMELVYLGLSAAARGKGMGDLMMRHALAVAHAQGAGSLTLAVDAANLPAMRLYFRSGFARIGSKLALLRDLRSGRDINAVTTGAR